MLKHTTAAVGTLIRRMLVMVVAMRLDRTTLQIRWRTLSSSVRPSSYLRLTCCREAAALQSKFVNETIYKGDSQSTLHLISTHSSHCSHHSTFSVAFSLTDVWYFSFPSPIVTKTSLVPFLPLMLRPRAFLTENACVNVTL